MDEEGLDHVFTALADVTRRRIIDYLRDENEQSLFQICTQLIIASQATGGKGLSRQAVSQHLDILERAGLVRVSWSGRTKLHSIDLKPLQEATNLWLKARLK
jgi:DNA-binding transcriptional ArsR family regulator